MYEFLDHSSDLEVSVIANSFEELLKDSALAITHATSKSQKNERKITLNLSGGAEDKLMKLLEELIYLQSTEDFYVVDLQLKGDECIVFGGSAQVIDEIKAVTWYEFWVKNEGGFWSAHFICDL